MGSGLIIGRLYHGEWLAAQVDNEYDRFYWQPAIFDPAVFLLMQSPSNRERRRRGSAIDVAIPAGSALGVVRETARLLAAERLRAPMRLAFWLSRPQVRVRPADTWFRVDRG